MPFGKSLLIGHHNTRSSAVHIRKVWKQINFLYAEYFSCIYCHLLNFSKLTFFEHFFWEHYQSVKVLDPGQDRHFVGSDLALAKVISR